MTRLILFTAPLCEPSKRLKKLLDSQELYYEEIDLEKTPEPAIKYDIRATPTLVAVFDSGVEIERKVGAISYESLGDFLGLLP